MKARKTELAYGQKWDLAVLEADKKLASDALKVMKLYKAGGMDPITGSKVTERTNTEAALVWRAFSAIEREKGIRNLIPNTLNIIRTGFNGFINSLNSSISQMH